MIRLEINQEFAPENQRLPEALIISIEEAINENVPSIPDGEIAVAYISDAEIKRLNRMYRKKDRVTDVLSFSYLDQKHDHIGDVVISLAQAERQALEGDLQLELVDLIVHGVLHALGYDHKEAADAEEMFPLQDKIVALVQ